MLVLGCSDDKSGPTSPGSGSSLRARWSGDSGIGAFLQQKCTTCHRAGGQASFYDLTTYSGAMSGGRIRPGNATGSQLVRRLTGEDQPRMPQGGLFLENTQIDSIKAWIDAGALEN
ncbi:MAG: hypothetical protein FJY67_01515 [Calditrichaeota bacterium]|nr:hypothetical protein [Calditrichota bacterium]